MTSIALIAVVILVGVLDVWLYTQVLDRLHAAEIRLEALHDRLFPGERR